MPDCGTTFIWARRAFGPWAGWLGGWGVALAGVVVLANLAQVAGQYLWLLVGDGSLAHNSLVVTATGVLFIAFMTLVNYRGIRLGEHVQRILTYVQYVSLGIFAVALVFRIAGGARRGRGQAFDFEWFNPAGAFADPGAVVHGALLALFIYWGWDTCLAVNEETENPAKTPGRGAVISAFVLVAIYVSVALLVMMYATVGTEGIGLGNEANQDDVFLAMKDVVPGPVGLADRRGRAGIRPVLHTDHHPSHGPRHPVHGRARGPSAEVRRSPRAQPDAGFLHPGDGRRRRRLLRGHERPQRKPAGRLHQLHQPLHRLLLRPDRLRLRLVLPATLRESARNLWFRGILPLLGALMLTAAFFVSAVQMWDPAYGDTQIFGVGGAFVSGVVLLALGVVLAVVCRFAPSTRGYFLRTSPPPARTRWAAVGCSHEQRRWPPSDPSDVLALDSLLSPDELAVRERVRDFTDQRIRPDRRLVRDAVFPLELAPELGELGVLGMHLEATAARAGPPSNTASPRWNWKPAIRDPHFVSVQGSLAMTAIHKWGSEDQKQEWLPRMAAGEVIGCFALTEPTAGSDPAP